MKPHPSRLEINPRSILPFIIFTICLRVLLATTYLPTYGVVGIVCSHFLLCWYKCTMEGVNVYFEKKFNAQKTRVWLLDEGLLKNEG